MEIEYCTTYEQKATGLQNRAHLSPDSILLFTRICSNQIFHMRNVRFPILIAAINNEGVVLKKALLKPEVDTFRTPNNTAHVIEASLGFVNFDKVKENEKFPNLKIGEINAKLRI